MYHSLLATLSAQASLATSIRPIIQSLTLIAGLASVFFLMHGGIHYIISRGKPDQLEQAKRTIRNALIGLIIVLAAGTLSFILMQAFPSSLSTSSSSLPQLQSITPNPTRNSLIDVMLSAVTGFLSVIIQAVGTPFLSALNYFTTSTPLLEQTPAVFHLWLVLVGLGDTLFILVIVLIGFHVMSASSFGLDEVNLSHLLPRFGLIFLLMNTSLYIIDGIISISNALISAVSLAAGNVTVWKTLSLVVNQDTGLSLAALLLMLIFLVFVVILLVYYVGRLITLFIGAVLSPFMILLWLIPGFRDFTETAAKVYLTTIFVLFVHTVILTLAASLFAGMINQSPNHVPNTFMALITGLATVFALLKTQGVLAQLSYVSLGPRTARQLGGQFINAVSSVTSLRRGSGRSSSGGGRSFRPTAFAVSYGGTTRASAARTPTSGSVTSQGRTRSYPSGTPHVNRIIDTPTSISRPGAIKKKLPGSDQALEAKISPPFSSSLSSPKGGKK